MPLWAKALVRPSVLRRTVLPPALGPERRSTPFVRRQIQIEGNYFGQLNRENGVARLPDADLAGRIGEGGSRPTQAVRKQGPGTQRVEGDERLVGCLEFRKVGAEGGREFGEDAQYLSLLLELEFANLVHGVDRPRRFDEKGLTTPGCVVHQTANLDAAPLGARARNSVHF